VGDQTAESPAEFVVTAPPPAITSISHDSVLAGLVIEPFRVTGEHLGGSTFAFLPEAAGGTGVAIESTTVDPSGTGATLSLRVGGAASGAFVLVATNDDGRSDERSTPHNTVRVFDLGIEPPQEVQVVGDSLSMVNARVPDDGAPTSGEAVGDVFSMVNLRVPDDGAPTTAEAAGRTFSVANTRLPDDQAPPTAEAVSATFSIENSP
jgi:hypothetical protein